MKHKEQSNVRCAKFIPFEDVLGLTTETGYSSIVIPGSGEPNFDAFEANPFETSKQRKEGLVHSLLEKLHPDSISLKVSTIGKIDDATQEVKEREKREEEDRALAELNKKEKKRVKKMRGKMKDGHVQEVKVQQMHEMTREKNKLAYLKEFRKAKEQTQTVTNDLEYLDKVDDQFDPFVAAVTGETSHKRPKK
jgi:U3 small nucleolar RNA-associated protein 7